MCVSKLLRMKQLDSIKVSTITDISTDCAMSVETKWDGEKKTKQTSSRTAKKISRALRQIYIELSRRWRCVTRQRDCNEMKTVNYNYDYYDQQEASYTLQHTCNMPGMTSSRQYWFDYRQQNVPRTIASASRGFYHHADHFHLAFTVWFNSINKCN